jgi:polyphenol oxidase
MFSEKNTQALPKITSNSFDAKIINHGFLTKNGGVSTGAYSSLNTCMKVTEDKRNVVKNLEIIASDFGVHPSALKLVNQVHSIIALRVGDVSTETAHVPADALVTKTNGVLIGVQTADCTPILFADHENKVIGAAHAGWKGALGGIIENTLGMMEKIGGRRENIVAVIGPTIAQKSYEVDADYRQRFLDKNMSNAEFFIPSINADHYMFDLPNFCVRVLQEQGVKLVENLEIDTYSNPEQFFSFRKTTHKDEKEFGGQFSGIMLV